MNNLLDGLTEFDVKRIFDSEGNKEVEGIDFENIGYKYLATNGDGLEMYKKNDVLVYYRPSDNFWYAEIDRSWLK